MDLYGAAAGGGPVARRPWSKVEDKVFESALVLCPEDVPDRWALVAAQLPGRTPQEALEHYQVLVADIDLIMRGAVDAPGSWDDNDGNDRRGGGGKPRGEERRRGVPWSEDEHRYGRKHTSNPRLLPFPPPPLLVSVPEASRFFSRSFPHCFVKAERNQQTLPSWQMAPTCQPPPLNRNRLSRVNSLRFAPPCVCVQVVSRGVGQVRAGRLEEHLAVLGEDADADAGGEPRAEVLHPAGQRRRPRLQAQEHP